MAPAPRFGTFSIVAHDANRGEWGVAVQSKFIAVGTVVPWAKVNVGVVATQAYANVRYGPEGLDLLAKGMAAEKVVEKLTRADDRRDERQVGIVDAKGQAASHTGKKCLEWAGHEVGDGFACQGNILFSAEVVKGMARAWETTPGDVPERLLAALRAGQREGGDRRGMQSAAILVVKERGGYDEGSDRWIDVRVDDHPSPIEELERVFRLYDLTLLSREDPSTLVDATPEVVRVVQQQLSVLGYASGAISGAWDSPTKVAFEKFVTEHNFENKARTDGKLWPSVLNYLDERSKAELDRRSRAHPIVPGALDRGPGASPGGSRSARRTDGAKS